MIEKKQCGDCRLELPVKQFACYRRVRHPLCRTCLAIDVHEFKEWVLPFVEARKLELDVWHWEEWEFTVCARIELTTADKASLLRRSTRVTQPRHRKDRRKVGPEALRPWKFALVGAQ